MLTDTWEVFMLALLLWREARNQSDDAMTAVACSVRNRVQNPRWWGHDWISVILAGWQYSSFNRNDPNATLFPSSTDSIFPHCLQIAQNVHDGTQPDCVQGAQSYFDKSLDGNPPKWATDGSQQHVCDMGDFHFWKV